MTISDERLLREEDDYIKRADVLRLIDEAFGWPPSSRGTVLTQLISNIAALLVEHRRAQAQPGEVEECAKALDSLAQKWPLRVESGLMQHAARLLRSMGGSSAPHRGAGDTAANANGPRVGESPAAGESPAQSIRALVEEQANDDGLWFNAQTAPEAYLQQQLRLLHEVIERTTK